MRGRILLRAEGKSPLSPPFPHGSAPSSQTLPRSTAVPCKAVSKVLWIFSTCGLVKPPGVLASYRVLQALFSCRSPSNPKVSSPTSRRCSTARFLIPCTAPAPCASSGFFPTVTTLPMAFGMIRKKTNGSCLLPVPRHWNFAMARNANWRSEIPSTFLHIQNTGSAGPLIAKPRSGWPFFPSPTPCPTVRENSSSSSAFSAGTPAQAKKASPRPSQPHSHALVVIPPP